MKCLDSHQLRRHVIVIACLHKAIVAPISHMIDLGDRSPDLYFTALNFYCYLGSWGA